ADLKPLAETMPPQISQLHLVRSGNSPALSLNYSSLGLFAPDHEEESVLVTVPVMARGQFAGALQGRFLLADLRQRMNAARGLLLLYALLYGAVLTVAGVFLLYRNVVRPVRDLMQATREVAAGDLEQILPEEGPKEIADLSRSFNQMTATLHDSRRQTEAHIDSLRQANQELASSRDEVVRGARMASVGHLAAGMAHEIGNPLGALVGYLGLLKGELAGDSREIAVRALSEAQRIDLLVRDLLDYAAPPRGEVEDFDPVALLRQAVELLEHQGAFSHRALADGLPTALPAVRMARHKLQQVFINLLLNARDACPPGAAIRLSAGRRQDGVWLTVADEGEGMAPQLLANIFDPFFTTKEPGKGRGLGLAVCQRIVEEVGGRIEVRSEPGKGSAFTVRLRSAEGIDG
ncbi:MAG: HAMP domain-containing histidine kinase, partial [Desulfuromonadales bacterium]|nr:HAMP domain-containing histidine kinase [Desulfuromonadales bacterium]